VRVSGQPAWILHLRPWRESSALVELFTRDHGRVGAVARGIRGPRQQALRAALQPLVPVEVDYLGRGEMVRLVRAEATGSGLALRGDALLAAFYVNELVLRLAPRGDPATPLFLRYGLMLSELGGELPLAWALRRFERDLLAELGVGFAPGEDAAGDPLDPAARYRVDAGDGPLRDPGHRPGSVSGAALLALGQDRCPPAEQLRELRPMLRTLISGQLGGRPLKSWDMLGRLQGARGGAPAGGAADSTSGEG
jgi:DNA repair protein RecO (recombination protein O)